MRLCCKVRVIGELFALGDARGRRMNDFKGRHFEGEIVLWADLSVAARAGRAIERRNTVIRVRSCGRALGYDGECQANSDVDSR